MKNIVLIGGGNQAHCAIDIIKKEGIYNIVGIIDSLHDVGSERFGYKILGRQEDILVLKQQYDIDAGLIAIGDNWGRYRVYNEIIKVIPGFEFVNAIHPSAVIGSNVDLGVGIIISAGCIINPRTIIEDFTLFVTGALIEHDSHVKEFASVSVGSVTGGYVKLGRFSAITVGVTVIDRVEIGENTVVGSGSLVVKSLPDNVLAYGNPAKIIRNRAPGERFLK
jgi:sugar O-acyltransferase (sialic acid O-acetyltransferase NeuD family)